MKNDYFNKIEIMWSLTDSEVIEYNTSGKILDKIVEAFRATKKDEFNDIYILPSHRKYAYIKCNNSINTIECTINQSHDTIVPIFDQEIEWKEYIVHRCIYSSNGSFGNLEDLQDIIRITCGKFYWDVEVIHNLTDSGYVIIGLIHGSTNGTQQDCIKAFEVCDVFFPNIGTRDIPLDKINDNYDAKSDKRTIKN